MSTTVDPLHVLKPVERFIFCTDWMLDQGRRLMAWIESHQALGRHPKVTRLASRLRIHKAQAVGHLQYLWWWALDFAPTGELSAFTPAEISAGAEWPGEPGPFLDALKDGWIDEDGRIHDWDDYAGRLVQARVKDRDRKRVQRTSNGHPKDIDGTADVPTEPNIPNQPNPTDQDPAADENVLRILKTLGIAAAAECSIIPGLTPAAVLLLYLEASTAKKLGKCNDVQRWMVGAFRNSYQVPITLKPVQVYKLWQTGRVTSICGHPIYGRIRHGVDKLELTEGDKTRIIPADELLAAAIGVKCD